MLREIGHGWRNLARTPRFAVVAAGSIGLGIAAASAIFSFVYAILLAPLPLPDSGRLVAMQESVDGRPLGANPQRMYDWLSVPGIENVTGYYGENYTLMSGKVPERVHGFRVFGNFFDTFKLQPELGRGFTEAERRGKAPAVAVISHSLWRSRFNADPSVLGRRVRINGELSEIIGVLPRSFQFEDAEIIAPEPGQGYGRSARFMMQVGRLRPGIALSAAQVEASTVADRLRRQYPDTDAGLRVELRFLRDDVSAEARTPLLVLLGAVGFVLLMMAVNVANLALSRTMSRSDEFAIRRALGASRWSIARLLSVELGIVVLMGGALGVIGSAWALDLLRTWAPAGLPRLGEVQLSGPVMAFAFAVTGICVLIAGVFPAWRASAIDSNGFMRSGRGSARRHRSQRVLVSAQVALSLALTVGGGLLFRSLWNLEGTPLGFQPERLLTFRLSLPWQMDEKQAADLYQRVLDRLRSVPEGEGAALADRLPLDGDSQSGDVRIAGLAPDALPTGSRIGLRAASPNLQELLRVPLLRGRFLDAADLPHRRAVINQTAAHRYFGTGNPIGQRIALRPSKREPSPESFYEIVGVVGDLPEHRRETTPAAAMYVPFTRTFWPLAHILVRTRSEPAAIADRVRKAVAEVDSSRAIELLRTMETFIDGRTSTDRLQAWLVGVFAGAAMLLAAVGVFGLVAASVADRRVELGIRMALGAAPARIVKEIVGRLAPQIGAGITAGIALAALLARTFEASLFGVKAADFATYVAAAATLTLVAFAAAWWPARRAAKLDAATVLRRD